MRAALVDYSQCLCRGTWSRWVVLAVAGCSGWAQAEETSPSLVPPPAVALSNYERIALGSFGAIEGGAVIARAEGAEALWYNAAGLVTASDDTVSANTSIFEVDRLAIDTGSDTSEDTHVDKVPTFVGTNLIFRADPAGARAFGDVAVGLALTTPIQWRQTADFQDSLQQEGGGVVIATRNAVIDYSTVTGGFGVGMALTPDLSLGMAGWLSRTTYDSIRNLSVRQRGANQALATSETEATAIRATAWHIRLSLGVQWRLHQHWRLGIHARSPGIAVYDDGRVSFDHYRNDGVTVRDASLATDADLSLRIPAELGLGLAYNRGRIEAEAVIRAYASTSRYDFLRVNNEVLAITTAVATNTTTSETLPYETISTRSYTVINAGLSMRWWMHDNFSLHLAYHTDRSPTRDDNDPAFKPIDLHHATVSLSRHGTNLTTSLGLRYSWGSNRSSLARDIISGDAVSTEFSLQTFALLVATSFRF